MSALLYAQISHAAYGSRKEIPGFLLTNRLDHKGSDVQAIFGQSDQAFIIAFRGTEPIAIKDLITTILIDKQEYPYAGDEQKGLLVHSGFMAAYRSVRDVVLRLVSESPALKIVVTGHSMGGALATLAALDIQYNMPHETVEAWTYGSPRVGNAVFVETYQRWVKVTQRYVNGNDPIVKVPTTDYQHVCKPILLPGGRGFDHARDAYVQNLGGEVDPLTVKAKNLFDSFFDS